jgi:protein-tyrosine-phosphatase
MTSMMGNAPQTTTTNSMVPTTNAQLHKAGIQQQAKQQQQFQQQALQQANVFLSVDPRLMDKNIVQYMSTKPTAGTGGSYIVEDEQETLAERSIDDDSDDWMDNPYAEARSLHSLSNIQPRFEQRQPLRQPTGFSVFNPPSGQFGLLA